MQLSLLDFRATPAPPPVVEMPALALSDKHVCPGTLLAKATWAAPLGPNCHRNLRTQNGDGAHIADVHDMAEAYPDDEPAPSERFRWQVHCRDYSVWAAGYAGSWEAAMERATWAASWSGWNMVNPPSAVVNPYMYLWARA